MIMKSASLRDSVSSRAIRSPVMRLSPMIRLISPQKASSFSSSTDTFTLIRLMRKPSSVSLRISRQVLWRMISVSTWMYPSFSAMGMNWSGNTMPVSSSLRRISASAVSKRPVRRLKTGWQ